MRSRELHVCVCVCEWSAIVRARVCADFPQTHAKIAVTPREQQCSYRDLSEILIQNSSKAMIFRARGVTPRARYGIGPCVHFACEGEAHEA